MEVKSFLEGASKGKNLGDFLFGL